MQFGLNESQELLKSNARKFFAAECPADRVRQLMETSTAFDEALWAKMAEQGYTGIIFPEEYGGVGLGAVDLILLMEEAGRALLPGPLFSTVALAGAAIEAVANASTKKMYLEPICSGEARATLAFLEREANWDSDALAMTAVKDRLNGEKLFVTDAGVADFIVVAARNGVYAVDAKASGLTIEPMNGIDMTRKLYALKFKDVPAEKIGDTSSLAKALNVATAALAAELVGGMQRTLDITVEYAKVRKQFGKPIGSYQAVQHQCADMYLETESARSAAYYAAWTLQENAPESATAASIAKMYASDAARTVGNRGIQVHGGMGFTWENDVQLYYKRAKASETMLGDATFHRDRIARAAIDNLAPESAKTA